MSNSAPKVYLDYTQEALDRAYDQRNWASNADEIIRAYGEDSAAIRAKHPHRYAVPYGPSDDETLDIFAPATPAPGGKAKIHVHVHGGSWRNLSKDDESIIAPTFTSHGAICVILNFSMIPKVRIPQMVAQLRGAIRWVHKHAAEFGGDPDQIHLSGHSSGGHLAGVLMTRDWTEDGLPADVLKSGLLISGMFDLRPVMLSARSSYVTLSDAEVRDMSAILHIDRLRAPIVLSWGGLESPEFQRHPQAFAAAVKAAGKPVSTLACEGLNHFEILQQLADPKTPLSRAALGLMGLGG